MKNLLRFRDYEDEKVARKLYLRALATGELEGPLTGKPSIDMPWLAQYPEEAITYQVPKQTMYEYLKNCIQDEPDRILVNYLGNEITAGEILENIDKTAEYFKQLGVRSKDRVAIDLPGMPETIYSLYALNKIGAIPVNIDPRLNAESLKRDLEVTQCKFFVGIDMVSSVIQEVSKKYPLKDIRIVSPLRSASNSSLKIKLAKGLSTMKEIKDGNFSFNRDHKYGAIRISNIDEHFLSSHDVVREDNDLSMIIFTGGTTGVHKGVKLTNYGFNQTVYDHNYIVDDVVNPGDTIYNPLPTFMSYGMTTLHLALCKKLYMYLVPDVPLDKFGDEIARIQPNIIYGGPIHYKRAKESELLREKGLPDTKIIVTGGEKVGLNEEKENNEFYSSLGVHDEFFNGFGSTEMHGPASVKVGRKHSLGSVGSPFPHIVAKICDLESGEKELSYGQDGELLWSGDTKMLGYLDDNETNKVMRGEWFVTGDIAHMNKNGELFITGRKKRQFVSGVDNVYIPEVENVIESIPEIEKCVVVSVNDEELRKVPYAYVVMKENLQGQGLEGIVEEKIKDEVAKKLSQSSIPRYYDYTSPLKYTGHGKVDFVTMEKDAEEKVMANQRVNRK